MEQQHNWWEEYKPQESFTMEVTVVYPIMVRSIVHNNTYRYTDSLGYVASSLEKAREWCQSNKDINPRDEQNWWWFVIMNEAVDGEYTGISGVAEMLDWDAKHIERQPLSGYTKPEEAEEAEAPKEEKPVKVKKPRKKKAGNCKADV